jgi:hypothetical protein
LISLEGAGGHPLPCLDGRNAPLIPQDAARSRLQQARQYRSRQDQHHYRKTDGTNIGHPVLGEAWTRDAGRQLINQLPGLPNLPQAAKFGVREMASQIVMDRTGDTRHTFDIHDRADVEKAERRFKELTGAGFTAAVRWGPGEQRVIRSFDPTAEETLFYPRLVGG